MPDEEGCQGAWAMGCRAKPNQLLLLSPSPRRSRVDGTADNPCEFVGLSQDSIGGGAEVQRDATRSLTGSIFNLLVRLLMPSESANLDQYSGGEVAHRPLQVCNPLFLRLALRVFEKPCMTDIYLQSECMTARVLICVHRSLRS